MRWSRSSWYLQPEGASTRDFPRSNSAHKVKQVGAQGGNGGGSCDQSNDTFLYHQLQIAATSQCVHQLSSSLIFFLCHSGGLFCNCLFFTSVSRLSRLLLCIMHISLLTFLCPLLALASPWPQFGVSASSTTSCNETGPWTTGGRNYNSTTTTTVSATSTFTPLTSTTSPYWNSTTTTTAINLTTSTSTSTTSTTSTTLRPSESAVRNVVSAPFQVAAFRPGSVIHFSPMNARGQRFYLGGPPGSYCPFGPDSPRADDCPSGEVTAFRDIGSLVSPAARNYSRINLSTVCRCSWGTTGLAF